MIQYLAELGLAMIALFLLGCLAGGLFQRRLGTVPAPAPQAGEPVADPAQTSGPSHSA